MASDMGRPVKIVADAQRAFVSDAIGQRLIVIDAAQCTIITVRQLPAAPGALLLDSTRQRLYIAQMGTGEILVLDSSTLEPIGSVKLAGLGYPRDLALDDERGRLYVAHDLSPKYGALSVIDVNSLSLERTRWGTLEEPLFQANTVMFDAHKRALYLGTASE